MYLEEMAATTIQAAFRGYKTRKSIEVDRESGLLSQRDSQIIPSERNLARLDVFQPPKDEGDEAHINKVESRTASGRRYSFMENIRKSVVSFMTGTEEGEDAGKVSFRINSKSLDIITKRIPLKNSIISAIKIPDNIWWIHLIKI